MIVSRNITTYINSLDAGIPEWLESLRDEAQAQEVPVIRKEMEPFLNVLLNMCSPCSILEIGTGVGYSALFMCHCLAGKDFHITTIENYEPRLTQARKHFAGNNNISLLEGDASGLVKNMSGSFDFIFLDGPKAQYTVMMPDLKRLLVPGGILLADNVLQDGELVMSRYAVPRRQRTIHERMREFLWNARHDPELDSSLISIGDGVLLCRKKTEWLHTGK